jgi:hypothetical protein
MGGTLRNMAEQLRAIEAEALRRHGQEEQAAGAKDVQ